nr:putative capsid protein [Crucivirus sp.]
MNKHIPIGIPVNVVQLDNMPQPKAGRVAVRRPAKKRVVVAPRRRVAAPRPRAAPRGSYKTKSGSKSGLFGTAGGAVGGMIGTALGGPGGGAIGSVLGRLGGAALSSIFGHGDYAVSNVPAIKENNLVLSNAAQVPQFGTGKVASKFVHREFLGDIYSSSTAGAFKIDNYPINPGVGTTFPWLSGVVGAKFQQYRINGMTFEYRSMSSDALNSTNTAFGSVVMSTDYDSADIVFASKQEMENTEYGVSCKPSCNMLHAIECARAQTPVSELYIRSFDVPSGKDIRLYDLGRFSIATVGFQGTSVNCGELWVSYDIDAFKAIEQVPGYQTPFAAYALNSASATSPLGTSQSLFATGADQIGLTFASENKVTWPLTTPIGSTYMVNYVLIGGSAAAITPPAVTTGGGMYVSSTVLLFTPHSGVTTQYAQGVWVIRYNGGGTPAAPPYFNIADFTWAPSSIPECDLFVTQVSGLWPGTFTGTTGEVPPSLADETEVPEYISVCEEKKAHTLLPVCVRRR